eukprot:6568669-Prymnesium_polylepis.1
MINKNAANPDIPMQSFFSLSECILNRCITSRIPKQIDLLQCRQGPAGAREGGHASVTDLVAAEVE